MFNDTAKVLKDSEHYLANKMSDEIRFEIVKSLGKSEKTTEIQSITMDSQEISSFCRSLQEFIEHSMHHLNDSIKKNKRRDGLYHSYNLIRFGQEKCSISYLYEMLEGQVAVLSSKALEAEEAIHVLDALKNSAIYREDQIAICFIQIVNYQVLNEKCDSG